MYLQSWSQDSAVQDLENNPAYKMSYTTSKSSQRVRQTTEYSETQVEMQKSDR